MPIDINCDMGESFGRYTLGNDESMMPYITSANIACGFHAGDPMVMDRTVALAARHSVGVGAHPGFPDLQGFGRRPLALSSTELENYILYQLGALAAFARAHDAPLAHVKVHGALNNMAAVDPKIAEAIAKGVARFSRELIVICLASSAMIEPTEALGLRVAKEAYADRVYEPDGTLQSRKIPGSVIEKPEKAAAQVVRLVRDGVIVAHTGQEIPVQADTVCIHGDTPTAIPIAQAIREKLEETGIKVKPLGSFL